MDPELTTSVPLNPNRRSPDVASATWNPPMRHTTFRFALAPTPAQVMMLDRHAGASSFAYNQCLRLVDDALAAKRAEPQVKVPWSGFDLINAFNAWKRSEPLDVSSSPLQMAPSPSM
jgi:Helix-turn-helix domain